MKNIVFIIESLQLGGAEKSLITLLRNLHHDQYKIDLLVTQPNGFFRSSLPDFVELHLIKIPRIKFFDRINYYVKRKLNKNQHHAQIFWRIANKYLSHFEKKYDIAISYNQGFATYYTAEFIDSPLKYAWINTDYSIAGYNISLDAEIYKSFKKIVIVSEDAKRGFERELQKINLSLDCIVIKDIIDKEEIITKSTEFKPKEISKNKITIVTVARLVNIKGIALAIDAFELLLNRNIPIQWIVVGDGPEGKQFKELVRIKGLTDDFHFVGAYSNPYPFMKYCDIYVQTSLFEGMGLTLIEASVLNKPIVTTNFTTAYSIIEDRVTGLICEMKPESIAESIIKLIENPNLGMNFSIELSKRHDFSKQESLIAIMKLLGG